MSKLISKNSRTLRCVFFFILVLSSSFEGFGQYYVLGQDPASVKWRQIKTDHFKLIYPEDFEKNAQKLGNLFEYMHEYGTITLGFKPSRVPVIIHNRDILPNAFSLWAPRRIELYTCPPQNSYPQAWLEQLAIHEYRHIVQMQMMNKGFTRGMTWLFGEQATAALTGIFIPMWFMEGDAVCTETALSHSGRGRIPSFEMELRAQLLEKGIYSYDKAILGSYKDFVPDQYVLGYPLVAATRAKFGYETWIKTMNVVARRPFLITPLNVGLKKTTGFNKTGLYKNILNELDSLWKIQDAGVAASSSKQISVQKEGSYSKFKYPHYAGDSLFIAERTSLDDISRFVMVNREGEEKVLCTPGFFSSDVFSINIGTGAFSSEGNKPGSFTVDNLSVGGGVIAWTERETDPRWQNRNYSVIKLYDFRTGKIKRLTHQSRYFAPAISPDGKTVAAIKVSYDNLTSIVLIDLSTGKEIETLLQSNDDFYMTPTWSEDGEKLVFILLNQHGKSIQLLAMKDRKVSCLLDASFQEIANPLFAGKYILFNGSYSGIENIYALNTTDGKLFQITNSRFGACNADYNSHSQTIVYSDYNSKGYRLVEARFDPANWIPFDGIQDRSIGLYKQLLKDEKGMVDSTTNVSHVFPSEPYSKAGNLFKFHSWAPLYINYDNSETKTGISFMSQNELSTAISILGYEWDYASNTGMYRLGFKWEGWYPVFDLDVASGKRSVVYSFEQEGEQRYYWNETKVSGGVKVPLLFSQGKHYTGLQISVHSTWQDYRRNTIPDTLSAYKNGTFNSIDYRIYAYRFIKQAQKDVYPRWGQIVDVNYRSSPFGTNSLGDMSSISATLFFPGLVRHHGIKFYSGIQFRNKGDFTYADLINTPRGYPALLSERLVNLSVNYKFPFLYPDLKIGPFAYFKRVKANLFYDHAYYGEEGTDHLFNSIGADLTADMHLIRFLLPLDLGIRAGYALKTQKWFVNTLFSINLSF